MTDAQVAELEQTLSKSLRSGTIEWALNLQICDMLQANPSLTPLAMKMIGTRLRKDKPVAVLLALGLLEMVVKNCGLAASRHVDDDLIDALLSLVKKREGWKYSIGRNLHKSVGGWLPQGVGIGEDERKLWLQASRKVLELLQLWADAFLLQEGELQPIFLAYKQLRCEGYQFPRNQHGASSGLRLVHGAEESPAFLATYTSAAAAPAQDVTTSASEPAAAPSGADESECAAADAPSSAVPARGGDMPTTIAVETVVVEAQEALDALRESQLPPLVTLGDELPAASSPSSTARAASARDAVVRLVQGDEEVDEAVLGALLQLLEELNERLSVVEQHGNYGSVHSAGACASASSSSAAPVAVLAAAEDDVDAEEVPPPPSDAPPDREQQELYDLMLARYLQERENESFMDHEATDAALALRLSLEENGYMHQQQGLESNQTPISQLQMVSCGRCGATNQANVSGEGGQHRFICYACGQNQLLPDSFARSSLQRRAAQQQLEAASRPTRHAPPARVICAGGNSELLIGEGGAELDPDVALSRGHTSAVTSAAASAAAVATAAFSSAASAMASSSSSNPMATSSGSSGAGLVPLLGSAPDGATGGLKKSAAHYANSFVRAGAHAVGSGDTGQVKRLGDGAVPSSEYAEMRDDSAPLCGGPPGSGGYGKNRSSAGVGLSFKAPWKRKKKGVGLLDSHDGESPLLDRVRVGEEWEMIRQADGRSYWHNSVTQVSQWQPPDAVSRYASLPDS